MLDNKNFFFKYKWIILSSILGILVLIPIAYIARMLFAFTLIGIASYASKPDFDIRIINSPYLHKEVLLPPYVFLVRMENFGGKKDQYFYLRDFDDLMGGVSKPTSAITFETFSLFKVIDVREGYAEVDCIFQKMDDPNIKFTDKCSEIFVIQDYSTRFQEMLNHFKDDKKFIVQTEFESMPPKPIYKLGNKYFYIAESEVSLINIFKETNRKNLYADDKSIEPIAHPFASTADDNDIDIDKKIRELFKLSDVKLDRLSN